MSKALPWQHLTHHTAYLEPGGQGHPPPKPLATSTGMPPPGNTGPSIATLIAAGVSFIHALATRVLPPPPDFSPSKKSLPSSPLILAVLAVLCLAVAVTVHAQGHEVTPTQAATGDNPPAQPTNLQVSATHDSVSLTWEASSDQTVTHYAVLRL